MLTGPRGLFLIAGQEKVVTVDLERVLTAPPVEHLTVHKKYGVDTIKRQLAQAAGTTGVA